MYKTDENGVSSYDLIANPGGFPPEYAQSIFNIKQRKSKKIDRILHPELSPDKKAGWAPGDGGWGTERLSGFEKAMECDGIDQYWVHEVTSDVLHKKYLARNMPFLLRGALDGWQGVR